MVTDATSNLDAGVTAVQAHLGARGDVSPLVEGPGRRDGQLNRPARGHEGEAPVDAARAAARRARRSRATSGSWPRRSSPT